MNVQRKLFEDWSNRDCCTGTCEGINFNRIAYDDSSEIYEDGNVELAWSAWNAALKENDRISEKFDNEGFPETAP